MTDSPDRTVSFQEVPAAEMLSDRQLDATFVDPGAMEDFLRRWYLNGFVDHGVGKVKFVRGKKGAGKTHFLRHLALTAGREGYLAVYLSALAGRLGAIDELYRAVASGIPWTDLIDRAAGEVVQKHLGYTDFDLAVPEFKAWVDENHASSVPHLKADIRDATDKWLAGLDLDPAWASAVRGGIQRRLAGETEMDPGLTLWLQGEKVGAFARSKLGVGGNIEKRNARAMLMSLAVLVHAAGWRGLVVLIDNLEVLAATERRDDVPYYTKLWRNQAYEMLRELVDEAHRAAWLLIVAAGGWEVFDDAKTGFPSYPALRDRIWSEVRIEQVDRFADLIDLDRLWQLDPADLTRLSEAWREGGGEPEVEHPRSGPLPESWGLEWSPVRRAVAGVLKAGGGEDDGR